MEGGEEFWSERSPSPVFHTRVFLLLSDANDRITLGQQTFQRVVSMCRPSGPLHRVLRLASDPRAGWSLRTLF